MKRRLLMGVMLAATLAGSPSFASDLIDEVVAELQKQGYFDIDVGQTLLGRTRITATSKTYDREIVLDPRTGEVLRDYWQIVEGANPSSGSGSVIANPDDSGSGSSGSGSSGSGSGSGSGSSGSGSGGSGSNSGSGSSGHGSGSNSGSGGSGHGSGGGGGSDDDDDD
jgi:hypothetical protein